MAQRSFAAEHFKVAAKALREMADILEQHPEDVVSMEQNITTDHMVLHGEPTGRTFSVVIETRYLKRS